MPGRLIPSWFLKAAAWHSVCGVPGTGKQLTHLLTQTFMVTRCAEMWRSVQSTLHVCHHLEANTSQPAEHSSAQLCFCSFRTLCMLGILLPRHWSTVVRQSYLPWIMHWMPRSMNHPTAGNLVCFKQTQLPNPNSFCYKTCLIKNIYIKLSFGGFELQVWLSYWLCFTQTKAFYFPTFLFF